MHVIVVLLVGLALLVQLPTAIPSAQLSYVSPRHNSRAVSPSTTIAVRHGDPLDPSSLRAELFTVRGELSGAHSGQVSLAEDGATAIWKSETPFTPGEAVEVRLAAGLRTANGAVLADHRWSFEVAQPLSPAARASWAAFLAEERGAPSTTPDSKDMQAAAGYITVPGSENIPAFNITTPAQGTAEGFLFIATYNIPLPRYLLILRDTGEPVYVKPIEGGLTLGDFKAHTVGGRRLLSYHVGGFNPIDGNTSAFTVLDERYQVVDVWTPGNGYRADIHDFLLLDNGNAIMLIYHPTPFDLSPYGGPADGAVVDVIVQELDPARNVIFEWHSLDHIPLTDTYTSLDQELVDYFHANAIEVDSDGNLLVSARNTSEIIKIDRSTGEVLWRLGGKANQFTFTNDDGFIFQHDIRRQPGGTITLFDNGTELDNGNLHARPYSRAVEYELDEVNKTITRVWEYRNTPDTFGRATGNVQRLPNGNTLIGWGTASLVTEVLPDGTKAFEMELGSAFSYRVFRFPWEGMPAEPPALALSEDSAAGDVTFAMSWNGFTGSGSYRIRGGRTPIEQPPIVTVDRQGFETQTTAEVPDDVCFFSVEVLDTEGEVLGTSDVVRRTSAACASASVTFVPVVLHGAP
ncbi:MAG: arylsulfotransferase family protein [Chloroflexota bacterium]